MENCEGYACPPSGGVPSSTLIVEQPMPDNLATTGADPTGGIFLAFALVSASVALAAWRWLRDD